MSMRAAALLALCLPACAERLVFRPVADTYVYATPWDSKVPEDSEAFDNHGAEAQVVLKGREYFALFEFELSEARGLTIERATFRIHRNPNPFPLAVVGISTISGSGPWGEGTQRGGRALPGSANYFFARAGEQPWAYAGSDITDVTFGLGGSLYAYLDARDAGDGWYEIDVPPALVYALITGDQFGWMLTDEKGQTFARYSLSSREQSQWPPALILEGARSDVTPPGPAWSLKSGDGVLESTIDEARALGRTTLRPGSVVLHFGGAGDDNGDGVATRYDLRYSQSPIDDTSFETAARVPRWMMDPLAPKPNPMATSNSLRDEVTAVVENLTPGAAYYFAVRATDKAGNTGPVAPLGAYRAFDRAYPALPGLTSARTAPAKSRTAAGPVQVWAVPELVKIDPKTGELLEGAENPDHRNANRVWDASTSTVRLTGARNEFVAFQVAVESAQAMSGIEMTVTAPLFAEAHLPEIFRSTGALQIYREWFVPDNAQTGEDRPWYADPLIPLESPVDLPARDNGVPVQTVQPFFVDVYIPHDAKPGLHTGELVVRAAGGFQRAVTLQVNVLPLELPDKLNFIVDLNAYGGVNSGYNIRRGTPEYRTLVRAYHRLAHLHRANLDVLGYSHSGSVEPDYSPPLAGDGADTKVASWADWDAHFGPLVDGSAFADLPRGPTPITNLYLNFFENWPGDLHANYRWDNYPRPSTTEEYRQLIARHGLEAGPIEQGFPQSYQDRFSAVAREFAEHFRQRGWTQTRYLIYFNDKYFYKDPALGGRGVSWWLFDEPNHRDDYRANSFLGWLAKRRLGDYPDVPITFRMDISYIDFMRDLLTGQVDLNTTSKRFFSKNRYLIDHRDRFGREFWNYASTNHPRESNSSVREWCWRVWAAGGEGVVPWNTVVGSEAWDRAEPLTVFYTGTKFGRNEPFGCLRLKAYRRGEQDVEYLVMLAGKAGWDRESVSREIGAVSDSSTSDSTLDELRARVVQALLEP